MPDRGDQELSRHLRLEAEGFGPGRDPWLAERDLVSRVARRRQERVRKAAAGTAVAVICGLVVLLGLSGPAHGSLTADPPMTRGAGHPAGHPIGVAGPPGSTSTGTWPGAGGSPSGPATPGPGPAGPGGSRPRSLSAPPTSHATPPTSLSAPPTGTGTTPTTGTTGTPTTSIPSPTTSVPTTSVPATSVPPSSVPPSTPTTTFASVPPPNQDVFTVTDSGQTVKVNVGDHIEIRMAACRAGSWPPPRSSDPSIVEPAGSTPQSSTGEIDYFYVAATSGQAVLQTPVTSSPCATPTGPFTLKIIVAS